MASFVFRTTLLRCAARSVATKYRTPNRWRSEQRSVWKSTFNMSLFYHQALYYCCTISVDRSKQSHIFCIISCNIASYRLNKRVRLLFNLCVFPNSYATAEDNKGPKIYTKTGDKGYLSASIFKILKVYYKKSYVDILTWFLLCRVLQHIHRRKKTKGRSHI